MEVGGFKFHRRALTALNQLDPSEQAQVLDLLRSLKGNAGRGWPTGTKKLPGDQALYLLRANDSLRLMVRAAEGQEPEVMDVVRHETLESFAGTRSKDGD